MRRKKPFKRVEAGGQYYYINDGSINGSPISYCNDGRGIDTNHRYEMANYCTNKSVMEQRALHEILNRLLWRYSEEHGGSVKWDGSTKYCIAYQNDWIVESFCSEKYYGAVYFNNYEDTEDAIHDIVEPFMFEHPEFVW